MKADEMFEKLGYEIDSTYEIEEHLYYCKNGEKIDFDLKRKDFYKYNLYGYRSVIKMELLQAINEKCKELRMDLKKEWKEIKGYELIKAIADGEIKERTTSISFMYGHDKTLLEIWNVKNTRREQQKR